MKNHFLLMLLISLTLAFTGCSSKKKNVPKRHIPTEKELAAFDARINSFAKELNINQLSYAIVNEKGVIQYKGIAADENTIYPIGTMSNIFTSALILQLHEEQKIDIKKSLAEYSTDNQHKNANIKQILSFTYLDKPGKTFKYEPSTYNLFENLLKATTGKNYCSLLRKNIIRTCSLKKTSADENTSICKACKSSVADLAKFSIAIDNHKLFTDANSYELMFRPVYLSDGEITPSALGWFVQFYNDKKYVWSFGEGKDFSSLIIKSLTDSIALIMLANSENLNVPFALNNCDLFSSPVACEFVKIFNLYKEKLPDPDYNAQPDSIEKELAFCNKSPFRDLLVKEYLDYIKMLDYTHNSKAKLLETVFKKALPYEMPYTLISKTPRALIENAGDYVNLSRNFELTNDTIVNIYSVGEYVKELKHNIWEYDLVEFYIDYQNNKKKDFNPEFHRQYRFNYDFPDITGNFSTKENIKFVQTEPSKNSYLFEIGIPWKTLGNTKAEVGKKIGFDMNANDNDGTPVVRKNFVTWHFEKQQQAWADASVFGTLILSNAIGKLNDSICYSIETTAPVNIDGKIDASWNAAQKYGLNRTTFPKYPDNKDFSVNYRSMWDNDNLYLLIEVTDNIKYKLPKGGDWGWIENDKQDTVWIMKEADTKYAGGSESNRYVDTQVKLEKGKYTLKYKTNQTNSYGRWTNERPEVSFYGIAVY